MTCIKCGGKTKGYKCVDCGKDSSKHGKHNVCKEGVCMPKCVGCDEAESKCRC